jgi:homoserine dehydrogenase
VLPQFVNRESQLYNVRQEYNGVIIESSLADKQFFYGKGAGSFPTASAVLSDISALRYNYRYEYKKLQQLHVAELSTDFYLKVYVSFEQLYQVPKEMFEEIFQWSSSENHCHVTGIIHCSKLKESDWRKWQGVSLILLPEGICDVKDVPVSKRKKEAVFAF